MSTMHRKPAGEQGAIACSVQTVNFEPVTLPDEKEAIELHFVRYFVQAAAQIGIFEPDLRQELVPNQTDDFDFTVTTSDGPLYIELLEIAPLCGPYEGASGMYDMYERARWVHGEVIKKSRRYQGATDRPIYLLSYTTHWAFVLSDTVIAAISTLFDREPPIFVSVFHLIHVDPKALSLTRLYPASDRATRIDPELLRDRVAINLNPKKCHHVT